MESERGGKVPYSLTLSWFHKNDLVLTPQHLPVYVICGSFLVTALSFIPMFDDFMLEYLCNFSSFFKKALTCLSVAEGKLFDEKTRGRKSHDMVP
jgi:hypothetical protein